MGLEAPEESAEAALGEEELATDLALDDDDGGMGAFERDEGLDDGAAEGLELGDAGSIDEARATHDDGREVDIGAVDADLVGAEAEGEDTHAAGLAIEDEDALDAEGADADDHGAEGPLAADDDLDESAFPEMDADGTGDFEEPFEGAELTELPAARALPWAEARWAQRSELGSEIPCTCLALTEAGVVVGTSAGVVRFDLDSRGTEPLDGVSGDVRSVVASRSLLVASTHRGELLAWSLSRPNAAPRSLGDLGRVELAAGASCVWIGAGGGVSRIDDAVRDLRAIASQGVRAIASSGGALVMLTEQGEGRFALVRARGDDEPHGVRLLDGGLDVPLGATSPALATTAGGRAIAIVGPELGVAVSRDEGQTFERFAVDALATAVFAGDSPAAPLLFVFIEDGRASLAEVTAAGEARRLTELLGDPTLGIAFAWDARRELLWVASSAGLAAYGRSQRH